MMIDGYTFWGVSYMPYNYHMEGLRFKVDDNTIGILAGEPWPDKTDVDGEEVDVVMSRIALFRPIEKVETAVFED